MKTLFIAKKLAAVAVLAVLAGAAPAWAAGSNGEKLNPERLAHLEQTANNAEDYHNLASLYERRAEMLEEKAARHRKLEKRYASAPASLIRKRANAWNTPQRQRQLAEKAERAAAEAKEMAQTHRKRAETSSAAVD